MLLATFVVLFLLCVPRHALKATLPQDKILKSLSFFGVDKDLGQTLIDTAEVSVQTFTPSTSCFLSPAQQKAVTEAFKDVVDLKFHFYGGYPQAERRRALFRRRSVVEVDAVVDGEAGGEGAADALEGVNVDDLVALVNVEGNFLFEKATFDDFRGAVLQALPPASRGDAAVGDVVLDGERGAQVLLCPEDCGTLCASLKQVLSVPVDVARQELSALKVRPQSVKALQTVEASMRLDAVASAGFGYSRSKMAGLVDKGLVCVDFKEVRNAAQQLRAGQEVSVRGAGRLLVEEAEQTSKGRFKVKMRRFT